MKIPKLGEASEPKFQPKVSTIGGASFKLKSFLFAASMWKTWVGKIPWRREKLPTPVFLPGEFHGLYSPWGCKESDMTEQIPLSRRNFTLGLRLVLLSFLKSLFINFWTLEELRHELLLLNFSELIL